jgi:hypothetical protein
MVLYSINCLPGQRCARDDDEPIMIHYHATVRRTVYCTAPVLRSCCVRKCVRRIRLRGLLHLDTVLRWLTKIAITCSRD